MRMPCRITDEQFDNPWEGIEFGEESMKNRDLTLYDIMGSDHYILSRTKDTNIEIEVIDEDGEKVFYETLHPFAWNSLVAFARNVILQDKKIQKELEAND